MSENAPRSETAVGDDADAIQRLRRRVERERAARRAAEQILERKARELFELNEALEARVQERTRQLEAAQRQALSLASRDQLTGLCSRTRHVEHLDRCIGDAAAEGGTVALLLIDLDEFKAVNDGLGHGAGDHALTVMADRIAQVIRADDQVARLGGDEFAVVCRFERGASDSVLAEICERIVGAMTQPVDYGDRPIQLACSIGACIFPQHAATASDLRRRADIALYETKHRGGGGWLIFDPRMAAAIEARQQLMAELSHALRAPNGRSGAIELWWQPKVDLASGRIDGAEGLCRWRHPERGVIAPGDFVPEAERSGLIELLGLEVLRQGCRNAAPWIRDGALRAVSLNVSPSQLRCANFVRGVKRSLRAAECPPGALEIEITENMILDDLDAARDRLGQLASAGVRIALDDFGAGYSNLGVLRALPLDVLKIDRAFVGDLEAQTADAQPAAILRAMIEMGRALRMQVVAEGVETPAQAATLRALGCDLGQGFLWSTPLPAEEFAALLAARPAGDVAPSDVAAARA